MRKRICVIAAAMSALSLLVFAGVKVVQRKRRARYI